MTKRLSLCLMLAVLGTACGDDDTPEDAGMDATEDVTPIEDAGSDATADASPDTEPDAASDAEPDGGSDDPFESTGELREFFSELDGAFCRQIYECPSARDDNQFSALLFDDAASCEAAIQEFGFTRNQERALTYAVNTGEVVFDPEGAAQCLTRINGSCSGLDLDDACGGAFLGQVPPGESCSHIESCTAGNYCVREGSSCGGTCAPKKSDGEDCGFNAECVGFCFGRTPPDDSYVSTCAPSSPATIAMQGESCGETADAISYCARGLFCGRESEVCEAPAAVGQACDRDDIPCPAGTVCVMNTCTTIAVAAEGEACQTSELGPICSFPQRLSCSEDSSTCVVVGDGTAGATCRGGDSGAFDCNDGLFCDRSDDTCKLLREAGETCASNNDCRSDVCDDTSGVCADRPCNVR